MDSERLATALVMSMILIIAVMGLTIDLWRMERKLKKIDERFQILGERVAKLEGRADVVRQ